MRRKIRALAAEGRASALILVVAADRHVRHHSISSCPSFYASVWDQNLTKIALALAGVLDERRQFHHVPHGQLQDLTMDTVFTVFGNMRQDSNTMLMALLVFLAAGTLGLLA